MAFKTRINKSFTKGFVVLAAMLVSVALSATQAQAGSWPGGNGRIIYSNSPDDSQLYTVNPDGSDVQQLTTIGFSWGGEYSADGTRIVFNSTRIDGFSNDIFVMNADGTNQVNLTNSSGVMDQDPTWSPDSSQIAFLSDRNGASEIFVMNADGTNPVAIGVPVSMQIYAKLRWSPDGARLLFNNANDLFVVNADGTGLTNLSTTFGLTGNEGAPVWSPDSSQIAFYSSGGSLATGLYVINTDGTGLDQVTPLAGWGETGLYWSPDGTRLVYAERDFAFPQPLFDYFTIDIAGTNPQPLGFSAEFSAALFGSGLSLAWQPLVTPPAAPPTTPATPAAPGAPAAAGGNLADTGTNQYPLIVLAAALITLSAAPILRRKLINMIRE